MFVDASALVAIMLEEPEAVAMSEALEGSPENVTSPLAVFETIAVVMSRRRVSRQRAQLDLDRVLATAGISVIPITDAIGRAALDAFARYGKGRGHPAQLNMGDCFAYAASVTLGVPLLHKGDDFAETDLGG